MSKYFVAERFDPGSYFPFNLCLCIRRHSSLQHETSDIIPRWDSLASQPRASRTASGMLIAMMMMCGRVKLIPMKEKQIELMTM